MPTPPAPIDLAFALTRQGRSADAEEVLRREPRAVEQRYGTGGPRWAGRAE